MRHRNGKMQAGSIQPLLNFDWWILTGNLFFSDLNLSRPLAHPPYYRSFQITSSEEKKNKKKTTKKKMAVTRLLVPVVLIMFEIFVGVTIATPSFGVPLTAFPSASPPSPALPSVSPAPSPPSDIIITPGFLPDLPEGSPAPTSSSSLSTIPTQLITTPPPATSQQSSSLSTSDSFNELMFIDPPEESPAPTSPSPLSTIPTHFVITSPPTTSHPSYPSPSAAADKFPSSASSHYFFSMPAASDTFPEISIMADAPEESPASSCPSPLSTISTHFMTTSSPVPSRHARIIDSEPSAAAQLPSGRLWLAASGSALVAVAAIVLF